LEEEELRRLSSASLRFSTLLPSSSRDLCHKKIN
jgi:hypothetical protein